MTQVLEYEDDSSAAAAPAHGLLWVAMGLAGAVAMAAQASFELSALAAAPPAAMAAPAAVRRLPDARLANNNQGKEAVMYTRRSFLAFAAAAQAIGPLARAVPVHNTGPLVARLPEVLVKSHAGRDVYFCNDPVSGRLAILNLQYADSTGLQLPPPRRQPGMEAGEAYLYSLTRQRAIAGQADLRRYMDAYGRGGAWPFADGAPEDVELVRLRLGIYNGT